MKELVWAYGRHINRTTENLGDAMARQCGYAIYPFPMVVPRVRRIPAMIATVRWSDGRLKAFSNLHPWTARQVRLPKKWEEKPVVVIMGANILSSAPHFFYQDLDMASVLRDRLAGRPTFMYDAVPLRLLRLLHQQQLKFYRKASGIMVMSHWVKNSIIASGAIDARRVHVVGAASNLGQVFSDNVYQDRNLEAKTLVFVGRDFARKGGHVLLKAWHHVKAHVPGARLRIIGPPDVPHDNDPSIIWSGPLPASQLIPILQQSTGLVIPSLWEPFGIAFLEAMAMGLPVIGANHMAMPEFIPDEAGYLAQPGDVDSLVQAIMALLTQPEKTWQMSQNAYAHAKNFTWSRIATRFDQIIEEATAR